MVPLTQQAHAALQRVLRPGDLAIDATVGNGHDTLFLARTVGPEGKVCGIDIQPAAMTETTAHLQREKLSNVRLILGDHARLAELVPADWHGRVGGVMFNLGYLPGGDKSLVTLPHSTLAGLEASIGLLRPGGVLSVLAYRGHPGGDEEYAAVRGWCERLTTRAAMVIEQQSDGENGPVLLLIIRDASSGSADERR